MCSLRVQTFFVFKTLTQYRSKVRLFLVYLTHLQTFAMCYTNESMPVSNLQWSPQVVQIPTFFCSKHCNTILLIHIWILRTEFKCWTPSLKELFQSYPYYQQKLASLVPSDTNFSPRNWNNMNTYSSSKRYWLDGNLN